MAAPMMQLPAWRAPDPIDLNNFAKPVANALLQWQQDAKEKQRGNIWKFAAEAKVDGKVVAEATYAAMILDR